MAFDPTSLDLRGLFRDSDMFDSPRRWAAAGFKILNRSGKIMVARHPAVRGLLFKRYAGEISQKEQLTNFERRLEGARRLRTLVDRLGLTRIIVPHKWIVELPTHRRSHVLIVERLEILGDLQTSAAYRRIEPDTLTQLCCVLFHFRGMDSNTKNLPFTEDGRIALVDTEHWDRHSRKPYLHHIGKHLGSSSWKLARKIFHQLEDGKVPDFLVNDRLDSAGLADFGGDTSSSSSSLSSSS